MTAADLYNSRDQQPGPLDAVAAYDWIVRLGRDTSPDGWDTLRAVAEDDTGEAFSELVDTGAEIGYVLGEDDALGERRLGVWFDALQKVYRLELEREAEIAAEADAARQLLAGLDEAGR